MEQSLWAKLETFLSGPRKEIVCTMPVKWKWLNNAKNTFVQPWIFHKNVAKKQVSMKIKMLLQKTISLYCLLGDWTQFSFGRCVISSWLPLRCCSTWVWYSAVVVRVCDKHYRVNLTVFIYFYGFIFKSDFKHYFLSDKGMERFF